LAYLVPLDVDVTGNITAKICEVWSKFNIFSWLPWQWSPFSIFFNPPKAAFLQSFMKFDERNPIFFLNPLFFVSMATATKFVQQIPIFLAYLVPLDVDVVPIKLHQFLFGE
jgi:hypothetical protein